MPLECSNVRCTRTLSASELRAKWHARYNLCPACTQTVVLKGLPVAGFIPSPAIRSIASMVLKRARVTPTDIAKATRYARGKEYPRGHWQDRPAYRMAVLKYGKRQRRLHHLLLGRRTAPSAASLAAAVVHYTLVINVMGLGHRYAVYAAGGTFFGRQGMCPPEGRKDAVLLGDSPYSKWRLNYADVSMLGGHVLKAAKKMGITPKDGDLQAFITTAYLQCVAAGTYRPPVSVPHHAMRTNFTGDSLFDHQLAPDAIHKSGVPRRYLKAIRRSSGEIRKAWPEGIDPPSDLIPKQPTAAKTVRTPDTSWLFERI